MCVGLLWWAEECVGFRRVFINGLSLFYLQEVVDKDMEVGTEVKAMIVAVTATISTLVEKEAINC